MEFSLIIKILIGVMLLLCECTLKTGKKNKEPNHDEGNPCKCDAIERKNNSTEIVHSFGWALIGTNHSVQLQCKFEKEVYCAWLRRHFHVDINNRYHYVARHGGHHTKDCSIQIDQFKSIDAGQWICKSLANSMDRAALGANICLIHHVEITEHPKSHTVQCKAQQHIHLRCMFDTEVNCMWVHNGIDVTCNGRYTFNAEGSTSDCSLQISPFSEADVGTWECRNVKNSTQLTVTSNKANLSYKSNPSKPKIYSDTSDYCTFTCMHENETQKDRVRWEMNGREVEEQNSRVLKHKNRYFQYVKITLDNSTFVNGYLGCVAESGTTPVEGEDLQKCKDQDHHKNMQRSIGEDTRNTDKSQGASIKPGRLSIFIVAASVLRTLLKLIK